MALTERKKREIHALSDASYEALVAVAKRAKDAGETVQPHEMKIKPKVTTSRKP
jgi:hypothetical protein